MATPPKKIKGDPPRPKPNFTYELGKQLIGEMKRKIPANREVKFKKYSKYENVHHRKGCEKLTDNFCMEPKLIKPY